MAASGLVPAFGYTRERIHFAIVLDADGTPAGPPIDLRAPAGERSTGPLVAVPRPEKRTSGIAPNFLWDKSSYALGVTAGDGRRTTAEHAAFRERHTEILAGVGDPGLVALRRFIDRWQPTDFTNLGWPDQIRDQNVVFRFAGEPTAYVHESRAARELWAWLLERGAGREAVCLATAERGAIARIHPSIKGVWGAQPTGASLVSFNLDAFASYGHEQGENAPTATSVALAYAAALNSFLQRDSHHRLQIGDAATVYWAEACDPSIARRAERAFAELLGERDDPGAGGEAACAGLFEAVRDGALIDELVPELTRRVRFHVLGLSPNSARLAVRFWLEDDFARIARHVARHVAAMRLSPPPADASPSLWRCLIETAAQRKTENIPPGLAGAWFSAIVTGQLYPMTLLTVLLMRLRADNDVNGLRVAVLKATLMSHGWVDVPSALDVGCTEVGYRLGRLFSAYEHVQSQAFGGSIGTTIRNSRYAIASTSPRASFGALERSARRHLADLHRQRPAAAFALAEQLEQIAVGAGAIPRAQPLVQQALFAIGYYHQRAEFQRLKRAATPAGESTACP